jgi:hypothetical protein
MMTILRTYSRALLRVFVPACFLLFAGCVNLDDVAELTKLADDAQQTLPAVVADIPASCQRQNHILDETPSSEKPPLTPQDCKPYQDVADHVTKDQSVLIAYFDALGKLASNTPLSYSQTIDTNIATIGSMPNLSAHAIAASTAAQKIGKILADAVTNSYRRHKVNSIILETDGAVQELTADLKKVVTQDYAGILSNENLIMDTYYKSPLSTRHAEAEERLAMVLVQRQYDGDAAALQARQSAAVEYGKVMDNLAALHGKLKEAAEKKANLKEIAKEVGPLLSSLKDAISELRTELKK